MDECMIFPSNFIYNFFFLLDEYVDCYRRYSYQLVIVATPYEQKKWAWNQGEKHNHNGRKAKGERLP